jgi:hypothetical protein
MEETLQSNYSSIAWKWIEITIPYRCFNVDLAHILLVDNYVGCRSEKNVI